MAKLSNTKRSSNRDGGNGTGVLDSPREETFKTSFGTDSELFRVTSEWVEKVYDGALPAKITQEFRGPANILKERLNAITDVLAMRRADIRALIDASREGRLDVRADSAKYKGNNGELMEGI